MQSRRSQLIWIACHQSRRHVSALYITGDKAKENYVTLQPHMDFEETFSNRKQLEQSIQKRKMPIDLSQILSKYDKYKVITTKMKEFEQQREAVAQKLKSLSKSKNDTREQSEQLKEQGKTLREAMKTLRDNSYTTEDDFIHAYLNLPNSLHKDCPVDGQEKLIFRSAVPPPKQGAPPHLQRDDLIHFIDKSRYYLLKAAAEFDVECTYACTDYFVEKGDFLQTTNPDFVRAVLLEANATPLSQYHMVPEENLQNKLNVAYLTGGGAFESFLGALTKLSVYPTVLPLCFVASGRSYHKVSDENMSANLYTATQTNAVQTCVATLTAGEADAQMERILNLAVDFYQSLGIHFRIVYADASVLTPAEALRAVIEIYSPAEKRYVEVGHVSNFTDFVSKRILFSMRDKKDYHFLHLVGGPVLYTTRLIAALLENGIPLTDCKLLGEQPKSSKAIEEFKNLFK